MPDHPHGTRACYKHGCHCLLCRAANAQYIAEYRKDRAHGRRRLCSLISAKEARKRVRQLQAEGVLVAQQLGLKHPSVRLQTDRVTWKKWLKIKALWRRYLWEPTEQNP